MQLVPGGPQAECARCLASCQAVAVAVRCDLPQALLGCTVYAAAAVNRADGVQHARPVLQGAEQLLTSLLKGDMRAATAAMSGHNDGPPHAAGAGERSNTEVSEADEDVDDEEDACMDTYLQPPSMVRSWQPLVTYAAVSALPRGAAVEVQPVALSLFGQDPASVQSEPRHPWKAHISGGTPHAPFTASKALEALSLLHRLCSN